MRNCFEKKFRRDDKMNLRMKVLELMLSWINKIFDARYSSWEGTDLIIMYLQLFAKTCSKILIILEV